MESTRLLCGAGAVLLPGEFTAEMFHQRNMCRCMHGHEHAPEWKHFFHVAVNFVGEGRKRRRGEKEEEEEGFFLVEVRNVMPTVGFCVVF